MTSSPELHGGIDPLPSIPAPIQHPPWRATNVRYNPGMRVLILLLLTWMLLGSSACAGLQGRADPPVPRHPFTRWHKSFHFATPWRLAAQGVEIKHSGLERTDGKPRTVTWIWETWNKSINRWSEYYHVPAELVIALIATESAPARGQPFYTRDSRSIRREDGFVSLSRTPQRLAVGLTQISVATARATLALEGVPETQVDDQWLMNGDNGIRAGTALLSRQARGELCNIATLFDPPVALAAYNAGGMYRMGGWSNRWKMRQYPFRTGKHVDRGIRFFNDAVLLLRTHRIAPRYGYRAYVYNPPRW